MEQEIDTEVLKYYGMIIIKGLLIAVILAGIFYAGAVVSCNNGGGKLYSLTCLTPKQIEITLIDGEVYRVPSNIKNCTEANDFFNIGG